MPPPPPPPSPPKIERLPSPPPIIPYIPPEPEPPRQFLVDGVFLFESGLNRIQRLQVTKPKINRPPQTPRRAFSKSPFLCVYYHLSYKSLFGKKLKIDNRLGNRFSQSIM